MKKIIAVFIIAITVFSFAACSSDMQVRVPDGMQLASDSEVCNWYFFVPEGWAINKAGVFSMAYLPLTDHVSMSFTDYSAGNYDSVEAYWDGTFDKLESSFSDLNMIEEGSDTTLADHAAKRYVYTATYGADKLKYMQVFLYANGVIYSFTYTAEVEVYDDYYGDVERVLEEFMFKFQADES